MTQQWHSSDRIQTIVRRRRLRRSLVSGIAVVAVAGVTVGVATAGGPARPSHLARPRSQPVVIVPGSHVGERLPGAIELVGNSTPLPSDPAATAAVSQASAALTLKLLQHAGELKDENGSANVSTSPYSLFVALAMIENGARGETATQIAGAIQASGIDMTTQNQGLAELTSALGSDASRSGITLESANSLWQQQGFPLKPSFLSTIATYYQAGVWQTDFANHNAQALAAIDHWTSAKTHGKITKLFNSLDPTTVLVLANALYFHAAWETPFDPAETTPQPFTTSTGKQVTASFMTGDPVQAVKTDGYQAAVLPYTGGSFEAVAIMPTTTSLPKTIENLSQSRLADMIKSVEAAPATAGISMPKFTTTASVDLRPVLTSLGMGSEFGRGDFSGLSTEATTIDQVRQRVYLGVGEAGTTAAAVTGGAMIGASVRVLAEPLRFDHPFLFLIRDKVTGAILFASEINDPTSS